MNIQILETKYLRAKIAYYEGTPIMSDAEFDGLESALKVNGSKVIEQVGTKRKDFDFRHPTKMLSLDKLQTEIVDGKTDYKIVDFNRWYGKHRVSLGYHNTLMASPKFDGSAINIIYHGTELFQVLTRGDGEFGKDVTKRFQPYVQNTLNIKDLHIEDTDVIEMRCEVVIDTALFNEKYFGPKEEGKYANPRNYVAGVIGKDDYSEEKVSELMVIPLHFLVNSKHVSQDHFKRNNFCGTDYNMGMCDHEYVDMIKYFEKNRELNKYQLDGVVLAFPEHTREQLGENDHDPEWSIAIKFVPEDVVTEFESIEWNISKRGEITPVVIMKPVQLVGTTVRRASGYNAGFIVNNQLGEGARFTVIKAGDIIPEITNVIVPSLHPVELPKICPYCATHLTFDSIHLKCSNERCEGRIAKKLSSAADVLDLKNVGGKTLEPFAENFMNMIELIKWVRVYGGTRKILDYGIIYQSRSHEIFVQAFTNIQSLSYDTVIRLMGYDNVGRKLSLQIAKEHSGLAPDFAKLERALVSKLHEVEIVQEIKTAVSDLEKLGIKIDRPIEEVKQVGTAVCMTGSPKKFGFKTKAEFLSQFNGVYEVKLTDKDCKFLITDDYTSTSSKMKTANKKGITIKTYEDFKQ